MISTKSVYNHDMFSKDDKMGDVEFDIKALVEAVIMDLHGLPSATIVARIEPSRQNCLPECSCIKWIDPRVVPPIEKCGMWRSGTIAALDRPSMYQSLIEFIRMFIQLLL